MREHLKVKWRLKVETTCGFERSRLGARTSREPRAELSASISEPTNGGKHFRLTGACLTFLGPFGPIVYLSPITIRPTCLPPPPPPPSRSLPRSLAPFESRPKSGARRTELDDWLPLFYLMTIDSKARR